MSDLQDDVQDGSIRHDVPSAEAGDLVVILSSDLIATVMERYFNDVMFKLPVTVVDLQSSEAGYAFTLAFAPSPVGVTPQRAEMTHEYFEVSEVNPDVREKERYSAGQRAKAAQSFNEIQERIEADPEQSEMLGKVATAMQAVAKRSHHKRKAVITDQRDAVERAIEAEEAEMTREWSE